MYLHNTYSMLQYNNKNYLFISIMTRQKLSCDMYTKRIMCNVEQVTITCY